MKFFLLAGALVFSSVLNADYILEYKMDGDTQKFLYHDASKAKLIIPSDDKSAIYKIGKKTYIVSGKGREKKIVDVDAIRAMASSFGYDPSSYNQEERFKPKIYKSSKRVVVAGIEGYEWRVSGEEDGEKFEEKLIVTDDKRLVETVRAMKNLFTAMSGINTQNSDIFEIEKGYVTIKGAGMVLSAFEEKELAPSEYQLPSDAKKQKIPQVDEQKMQALQKHLEEIAKEVKKAQEEAEIKAKAKKTQEKESEHSSQEVDIQKAANVLKSFF